MALDLEMGDTQALLDAVSLAAAADPAAAAQLQADADASGSLQAGLAGLQLSDCKENIMLGGQAGGVPGGSGRSLSDCGAAAGALQPLGEARAAALGLIMDADAEAETALAAADVAAPGGDEFAVWADDSSGSPPLMGSPRLQPLEGDQPAGKEEAGFATPVPAAAGEEGPVLVDPFSPAFQHHMLACLEPAVAEVRSLL